MSLADFLFEGKPPPATTTYGSTTSNIPQWLSDYTQGLIGRANAVAAEEYMGFPGPRLAQFSPDQVAAQSSVRSNAGSWRPGLDSAASLTSQAGNIDINGATAPYMMEGAKRAPGNLDYYMDPYIGGVINRAELVARRNFDENFMPTLDNKFTSSGQYGSSAHEREAYRGAREITEGLQSQSQAALSGAYANAGTQFNNDQQRQVALAGLAGDVATRTSDQMLRTGSQSADIATALQRAGLADASALSASGAEQQGFGQKNLDLAYDDFIRQRDDPKNQAAWLSNIIRGVPAPVSNTTTSTGPATEVGPSGLAQIGSILTAGKGIYDIFKARGGRVSSYMSAGV